MIMNQYWFINCGNCPTGVRCFNRGNTPNNIELDDLVNVCIFCVLSCESA